MSTFFLAFYFRTNENSENYKWKLHCNSEDLELISCLFCHQLPQANFELRRLAGKKGPDEEDFTKLANSVDEFTSCLLDPLKSNTESRHAFGDSLDYLLDAGIELKQKKVCNFKS